MANTRDNRAWFRMEYNKVFAIRNRAKASEKWCCRCGSVPMESNCKKGETLLPPPQLYYRIPWKSFCFSQNEFFFEFISTNGEHEKSNKTTLIFKHKSHLSHNNEKYVQHAMLTLIFCQREKEMNTQKGKKLICCRCLISFFQWI